MLAAEIEWMCALLHEMTVIITSIACMMIGTMWPKILAGNLFWQIGGFGSNPLIFPPPKLYSVLSSIFVSYSFHLYNRPAAGRASVIVGMEFTINSCVRGYHVSKGFWTPEVGEELAC